MQNEKIYNKNWSKWGGIQWEKKKCNGLIQSIFYYEARKQLINGVLGYDMC